MTATRLRTATLGLALLSGAALAPGTVSADATWEVAVDNRRGARQGVVEQYDAHDTRVGVTVLCDERTPNFIVLVDFPRHLRVEGRSRARWSDILVVADGESPLRAGERGSRVRALGQRDSARRVLRSDGAARLVRTLRAADRVELVVTPAIYGTAPPRIALDSRSFDASLRTACPWVSEHVVSVDGSAEP